MIVRLFCPVCAWEVAKKKLPHAYIEVPVPIASVADDGRYEVRCDAGHLSVVFLENLKFELLFDLGLNALLDGYPREAVSSFASALERFYEFYWRVAMTHLTVSMDEAATAWKAVARQSERQLGMFITAHLAIMRSAPPLLSPKDVKFRNDVIHNGYVPTLQEAVAFGNTVMALMNQTLDALRQTVPEALKKAYEEASPRPKKDPDAVTSEEIEGVVNVLTAVDVLNPPRGDDLRVGDVDAQFRRILRDRETNRMELVSKEEFDRRFPGMRESRRDEESGGSG